MIRNIIKTILKRAFSKLLPDMTMLRYLSYLPKIESFRKSHPEIYPVFIDRFRMYDYLNQVVIKKGPIVYLEFGVYRSASIKYWADINADIQSRFHGFDTFTGLSDKWESFSGSLEMKSFDVEGYCPQIDDSRVVFIKGMFQNTLPGYLDRHCAAQQVVIHNDADLYSSTLYVLTCANKIITPGTIIIFDEFSSVLHEFRALEDYCASYMREFVVVGATISSTDYYSQIAIRMK